MSGFDLSAYLGVFLDEVDEQLQILDENILQLEKDPFNKDTIQSIFRAAHTLKGSSASMGYEKMKEFTHHLENVFEQIRQEHIEVTPSLINIIFESIDLIRQLKDGIVEDCLDAIDIVPAIHALERLQEQPPLVEETLSVELDAPFELEEFQLNTLNNALTQGYNGFDIAITLMEEAFMKNVRAFIIYNQLTDLGEIIATSPSADTMENDEDFDGNMHFILVTKQSQEVILAVLNHIPDICTIDIQRKKTVEQAASPNVEAASEIIIEETMPQAKGKIISTVRVDVERLEYLMNLVGELVIDQTRLVDVRGRFAQKDISYETEFEVLDEVTNHLSRVISELQEGMMKTRMLSIEQLFNRFPRMVRDTAQKANKEIDFVMQGKETELDRTLIEEISDPIIHLLRNAIDHGIEPPADRLNNGKPAVGKVILSATHEENHVVIKISDDGRGIHPEKVKKASIEKGLITEAEAEKLSDKEVMFLIFKSGISTAEKLTDISGRGVGMDIVKSHIEKLNGIIDIDSTIGQGTTFTIKLPLTLAIIRSLLIKLGDQTFAIPLVNVLEIMRLNTEDIQTVKNQEVGVVRGRVLPLVRMKERLGIADAAAKAVHKKREFVVVVGIADKRIGIIADKTLGNQEIVIKSLGSYIGSPPFISGATIMGDGNVALILDVSLIVREHGAQMLEASEAEVEKQQDQENQLVTFKLDSEEYGIEIQRAKDIITVPTITKVAEAPDEILGIINLRGMMLQVVDLRKRLGLPEKARTKKSRIIVVEYQDQDIGFLVDEVTQVLKVNDMQIEKPQATYHYNQANLLKGITKLDQRVVLILAFDEIVSTLQIKNTY